MKLIGLTGPSGAGKSEISAILAKRGIPSVNADKVYHNLLVPPSPCLDALKERFGGSIIAPDGTLDRKALAGIVFAEGAEGLREELNGITHAFVIAKMRELIKVYSRSDCPALVLDVPLLFESGFDSECDVNVSVLADRAIRTDRIMLRDGLDYAAASERIAAQKPDEFYVSRSDLVIYNNSGADALPSYADRIMSAAGLTEKPI